MNDNVLYRNLSKLAHRVPEEDFGATFGASFRCGSIGRSVDPSSFACSTQYGGRSRPKSHFPRNGNRRCTRSFNVESLEELLFSSSDHLPVWSRLNLTRVWSTSRAAVARPMVRGSR